MPPWLRIQLNTSKVNSLQNWCASVSPSPRTWPPRAWWAYCVYVASQCHSVSQRTIRPGVDTEASCPFTRGRSVVAFCTSALPESASSEIAARLFASIFVLILDNDSGDPPQLRWTWTSPVYQPAGSGTVLETVIVVLAL